MMVLLERWVGAILSTAMLTVVILVMWIVFAHGSLSFPPVSFLASELGLYRGAQLPKGIPWEGRPLFFYVESAQQHPGGRYTVELQAR